MPNRQGHTNEPSNLPSTLPDPSLDLDDIDEGSPRRDGGGAPQTAAPKPGAAPLREGEKVAEWSDDAQDDEPPGFDADESGEPEER